MGSIKDRNGMDLTEAEDIKRIIHARISKIQNRNNKDLTKAEEIKNR